MRKIIGLVGSILSIGSVIGFVAMPCFAQSIGSTEYSATVTPTTIYPETVSPKIVETVAQTDRDNYTSPPSSNSQPDQQCLKIDSNSKMYVEYRGRRYDVPNTPSDYSSAIAKNRYCS